MVIGDSNVQSWLKNSYPKVSAIQTPFTEITPQSDDAPFSY